MLAHNPAPTERKRGSAGVADRLRIRERDQGLCQECVRVGCPGPGWLVDHITPLWQGGSDADDNKQLLCNVHHDAKSAAEAAERAKGC
jgi:5-methylcytosine-specific restriction protein A